MASLAAEEEECDGQIGVSLFSSGYIGSQERLYYNTASKTEGVHDHLKGLC